MRAELLNKRKDMKSIKNNLKEFLDKFKYGTTYKLEQEIGCRLRIANHYPNTETLIALYELVKPKASALYAATADEYYADFIKGIEPVIKIWYEI